MKWWSSPPDQWYENTARDVVCSFVLNFRVPVLAVSSDRIVKETFRKCVASTSKIFERRRSGRELVSVCAEIY